MEKEFIYFEGDDEELDEFLQDYFQQDQIDAVRHAIPQLNALLNEEEYIDIKKKTSNTTMQSFVVVNDYSINIRKTTLILFALLFDFVCTKGFAIGALTMIGVAGQTVRKLNENEKQIVQLINAEKIVIDSTTDEYSIKDDENHKYSSDEIKTIVDILVEKGIVNREGTKLRIAF